MLPQWLVPNPNPLQLNPLAQATPDQITAAAARGAQPASTMTIREQIAALALMGLSAIREIRMEVCAEAAQRGADALLIQLQMTAPPVPPPTTTPAAPAAATTGK